MSNLMSQYIFNKYLSTFYSCSLQKNVFPKYKTVFLSVDLDEGSDAPK